MTGPFVLDASVLIAAMTPYDAHHRDAVALLRHAAISGELIAHPISVAESAVGAAERGRIQQVKDAYAVLGIQTAPADPEQPWRLASLRGETGLPLPDRCVLDLALQTEGALATFDRRLAAAGRQRKVRLARL